MKTYEIYWSPTGQKIATVQATTAKAAKRKAPQPYRKYLGEIYVVEVGKTKNPSVTSFIPIRIVGEQLQALTKNPGDKKKFKSFVAKVKRALR